MSNGFHPLFRVGTAISEMQNPVTRSVVTLHPVFKPESEEDLDSFYEAFTMWCKSLWMMSRMDPYRLVAEHGGWVHKLPTLMVEDETP